MSQRTVHRSAAGTKPAHKRGHKKPPPRRKPPHAEKKHPPSPRRRRRRVSPVTVAVAVVAVLGAIAAVLTATSGTSTGIEYADVEITGAALPEATGGVDAAVGMEIPEVTGVDFDGNDVAITDDGRAKAIVLLAHWCPHCRREVPGVVSWLERTGGVPDVDLYAISTWATRTKPNWPPSAWFQRERWTAPVLVDDEASSAAAAYGLASTPMWVFVRPDGTVASRLSGAIGMEVAEAQMRALLD